LQEFLKKRIFHKSVEKVEQADSLFSAKQSHTDFGVKQANSLFYIFEKVLLMIHSPKHRLRNGL